MLNESEIGSIKLKQFILWGRPGKFLKGVVSKAERTYAFRMCRLWICLAVTETVAFAAAARPPRVLATWKPFNSCLKI